MGLLSFLAPLLGGLFGLGASMLMNKNKGGTDSAAGWKAPEQAWKPPAPPDLARPETTGPVQDAYDSQKAKAAAAASLNDTNPTGGMGLLGSAALKRKTLGVV